VPSTTSSYDNNDRLTSDSWDPNGNTVQSGANQYGYDSENRLLSLNQTAAHYVYDGDGQLVRKTAQGVTTTYLIDDQTPAGYTQIAEERISGAMQKSYVYGPQRIAMKDAAGLHYYVYDAHSGVRLLLDGSGNVTDSYDYDAFGNVIGRTGSADNSFTYRGEHMDSALGLQYLRARWMDPGKGRFATRDSWQGRADVVETLHSYGYARASPVDYVDETGHDFGLATIGIASTLSSLSLSALSLDSLLHRNQPLAKPSAHSPGQVIAAAGFIGFGIDQFLGPNKEVPAEMIADFTMALFTELVHYYVVEGFALNECKECLTIDALAFGVAVHDVKNGALLSYRMPTYLAYRAIGQSNIGHYEAILLQQRRLAGYGFLMSSCLTFGFRSMGVLYDVIAAVPIPPPQMFR
jgi:RHS repeat-associated protein